MKKKLLSILLLLASCTEYKEILIHNIDVDFPKADTIAMKHKLTFEMISHITDFAIKDTAIFALGSNKENMGHCYSINSGTPLNTVINCGKAANEVLNGTYMYIHKDSIQFVNFMLHEIKSISIDDILTKPIGERVVSKTVLPETIGSLNYKIIDNNIVIGNNYKNKKNAKYFIYDGNEPSLFGEYNIQIFESRVNQKLTLDIVPRLYQPMFASNGSKIIVADEYGVTLELINTNTKSITKDRFYTKISVGEQSESSGSISPPYLNTKKVYCTDKEIFCIVTQEDKIKSKEKRERFVNLFILVFDWNLNPVKKYYIGSSTENRYRVCMTEDCKKFYYLANEGEKQTLFEGIVK